MKRSWVEISLARLRRNVESIRKHLAASTEVIAVVKANAYGHGVEPVSKTLVESGIRHFAVATLEEAVQLRASVPRGEILIFGGCCPGEEKDFLHHDLTAAVFDGRPPAENLKFEMKVDTGMTRLGIDWKEAPELLRDARGIVGVFSHFSCSEDNPEFTRLQLDRFKQATVNLRCRRHISNSGGLQYPEAHLDAVRPGLALYGISPCPAVDYVEPILSWKTRLLAVKKVAKGERVGYCGTWTAERPSCIGVLPVGYADGYNRLLSNRGRVRIRSRLVSVLGQVSMDLSTIDLTDLPDPQVGEEAVLLEDRADSPLSAAALAEAIQTIPYEILTSIGPRVERVYV